MTALWPWLAVAGAGAWHGLNPATGWALAAAWGLHTGDRRQVWRALWPLACGHLASVMLVSVVLISVVMVAGGAAAFGLVTPFVMTTDGRVRAAVVLSAASAVVVLLLSCRVGRRGEHRCSGRPRALQRFGRTGLALWSFLMATAHGAGLMLLPALAPLCLSGVPGRELTASGSLGLALAVVAVHTVAQLLTTGVAAVLACRGLGRAGFVQTFSGAAERHAVAVSHLT